MSNKREIAKIAREIRKIKAQLNKSAVNFTAGKINKILAGEGFENVWLNVGYDKKKLAKPRQKGLAGPVSGPMDSGSQDFQLKGILAELLTNLQFQGATRMVDSGWADGRVYFPSKRGDIVVNFLWRTFPKSVREDGYRRNWLVYSFE